MNQFPYLLHETYSIGSGGSDLFRLKLQGASIVRLFAACEKDIVFPVTYAGEKPVITLSLLHETSDGVSYFVIV
jgi:hypothetical protein